MTETITTKPLVVHIVVPTPPHVSVIGVGTGLPGPPGPAGPEGKPSTPSVLGMYDWQTAEVTAPAPGQVAGPEIVDGADTLTINQTDQRGYSYSFFALDVGSHLLIRDTTGGVHDLIITSRVADPDTGTVAIDYLVSSTTGTPVQGHAVELTALGLIVDDSGFVQIPGPRGEQGTPGEQGVQGVQGIQGVPGVDGGVGAAGPQGQQGPAGPVGPAGLVWRGHWSANTSYVANDAVEYQGSSWFASAAPAVGEVPTLPSASWQLLASQGPQGIQGVAGPPGVAGVPGDQGTQGVQGVQGPVGAPGQAGQPGPQGQAGQTGATGPQGTPGATGPQGAPAPSYAANCPALAKNDTWTVVHNLGSVDAVAQVRTVATGAYLIPGTDYSLVAVSASTLNVLTKGVAWAAGSTRVVVKG